jgi:hypothetical protein
MLRERRSESNCPTIIVSYPACLLQFRFVPAPQTKTKRHAITHILAGYTYVNAISDRFKLKPINVDPETDVVSVRG